MHTRFLFCIVYLSRFLPAVWLHAAVNAEQVIEILQTSFKFSKFNHQDNN